MTKKLKASVIPDSEVKRLALIMAVNCVRNTVIEEYHGRGSISQEEMMEFNKQVANKLYTFLRIMFNGTSEQKDLLLKITGLFYPGNWDEPILDNDLAAVLTDTKKVKTLFKSVSNSLGSQKK